MRYKTDRPYGYGALALRTEARQQDRAVEQLQRLVYHMPQREIYTQFVRPEEVVKDPLPRCTWYVKVRVTKHDTWAMLASGVTETQARKFLVALSDRKYEGRPLYATRIGRE